MATLELEKMRLQIQGNTKHQQTKASSKPIDTSIRQSQHSYAEEVEIMEENVHNSSRSSHNMVLAQKRDLGIPKGKSVLSNYSDDLDERSDGSYDSGGHSDDDLQGNGKYGSQSKKNSSDHSDHDIPLREVSLEDANRQSYDPKRYNSQTQYTLGSTTNLPMSADNYGRAEQSIDSPERNDAFAGSKSSQFSTQNHDLEKNITLNSSGNKDRKVEISPEGVKITRYSNGTVKYLFPDGTSEVRFTNGDIKTQNPGDSTLVYFYAQAQTTHTTYPDGTEVYSFPTGQVLLLFTVAFP